MQWDLCFYNGQNGLFSLEETVDKILSKRLLVVFADRSLLALLPRGTWVGGVCTRFFARGECVRTGKEVFVIDLTDVVQDHRIEVYPDFALESLQGDMPNAGFSFLMIPSYSVVHRLAGIQFVARRWNESSPIMGCVVAADVGGSLMQESVVVDGQRGAMYTDSAVALHCKLFAGDRARLEVINPFSADMQNDVISFSASSLVLRECSVNGKTWNFADYIRQRGIQEGVPLVGKVQGMTQNVSLLFPLGKQSVTASATVLPLIQYRFAKSSEMLDESYVEVARRATRTVVASVHGYGNYEMMSRASESMEMFSGPFVLGEIAMLLTDQVTVNLVVSSAGEKAWS